MPGFTTANSPSKESNMKKEKIERINQLTALSRQRPLTPEETAERQALREEYRAAIRASLSGQLDHTVVQYPDGTRVALKKEKK